MSLAPAIIAREAEQADCSTRLPKQRLLSQRDVAEWLGCSTRWVRAQTYPDGPLACIRLGRSIRYEPEAVEKYIADNRAGA